MLTTVSRERAAADPACRFVVASRVPSPLLSALALCAALVLLVGCASTPATVVVTGPLDRYDHNRSREVTTWVYRGPGAWTVSRDPGTGVATEGPAVVSGTHRLPLASPPANAAYGAHAFDAFPHTERKGADGLHDGRLVPLFVGLSLPLSDRIAPPATRSDRADLLRYLGRGPDDQAGVETDPGNDAINPITLDERNGYGLVLKLLADSSRLANIEGIRAWAELHDTDVTQDVIDPRMRPAGFDVTRTIAVRWREFWFVLFALPTEDRRARSYSRLVVVPIRSRAPNADKR